MAIISNHNWGKLEGMPVINTSPIDNIFCLRMAQSGKDIICSRCYSIKTTIPNSPNNKRCRNAWRENGKLLSESVIPFGDLPIIKPKVKIRNGKQVHLKYVRCSSHGELLNETHYLNILNIAKKNPLITFVLWSKRADIIKKYGKKGVKNIILIYSEPRINCESPKVPNGFDKVFVIYEERVAKRLNINVNCGAKKCIECLKCYKLNGINQINEIVKGSPIDWANVFSLLIREIDDKDNSIIIEKISSPQHSLDEFIK